MYIHVNSADRLGKALASANAALTSKDTNPIVKSMLMETGAEELSIIVVDTASHQLKLSVPAQVSIPGALLVPGDRITKLINRLGDHPIQLRLEGAQIHAMAGLNDVHRFDLTQGDTADFPFDNDLPPVACIVDGDGLHEALKAVMFAATENEQEIIFAGADNTMALYTSLWMTTRSRFQMVELNFPFAFGVKKSILNGGRLPQWTGPVNVHVSDTGKIAFSQGNEHFMVRQANLDCPVEICDEAVSMQPIGSLVVSLQLLRSRVHTAAIDKQACVMKVKGKTDQSLVITAENAGVGGSTMQVPIQGRVSGVAAEVRLDTALVEKALKTIDGDDVRIDFIDYDGRGQDIALRVSNEANPEKRQTLVLPLQSQQTVAEQVAAAGQPQAAAV